MAEDNKLKESIQVQVEEYENTIGLKTIIIENDETQAYYEEIDDLNIHVAQDNNDVRKTEPNDYSKWDDRQHNKTSKIQIEKCAERPNCVLPYPTLTAIQPSTAAWKITTLIAVMLCIGFTSGFITVLVVKLSATASPCSENSCLNNGTCVVFAEKALCTCINGFDGTRCEITPCSSYPCLNGGHCSVFGSEYNCTCPLPLSGQRCEVTPCSNSSCQNEGTCFFHRMESRCACQNGFMGEHCEITPCSLNPCLNGGNCSVNGSKYNCKCPLALRGKRCEVTPCSSNPCVNGGNCSFNGSRYICACPTARNGTRCEASTDVFKTIQSPGFPEQYTNSLSQTWNIDVGTGYNAVLSFNYFNTESCCDFIYVCNGYSSCNQPLFNGSGLSLPSDVRATGQYMFVQFKTDGSVTKQGFLGVIFKK